MNITLIQIGKTDASFLREGVELYLKRINHYTKFDIVTLPDIKNARKLSRAQQKSEEGRLILTQVTDSDFLTLLDESGQETGSVEFAAWMQKRMNSGIRRLCFVIGDPYGFSPEVYARANQLLSLSRMTFSHQLIRLIFLEQLYRSFTILHNEPYHHQ
ncbi:MAG: 23S rRNA (pseudouridine(1915)-N(3))-methyltransferase RlmH [Rikenellaceae bacterium]|nr:23S rRNA (pseudouridine(1915)-N(3))-methyltransferase RlmH [Rikenellaceae bacterium]